MINSLFTKTKQKLLALLFLNPDKEFYLHEIARLTGVSQGTLHRELKRLVRDGIFQSRKAHKQVFYSVNNSHPIYTELGSIIVKTFGVAEQLTEALKPFRKETLVSFIYGSVAKGEDIGRSDIDLFVIGKVGFGDLSVALAKYEERLKREVNAVTASPSEFKKKYKEKNHFIRSVVDSEKIFLIGSEDDLRRLVEREVAQAPAH